MMGVSYYREHMWRYKWNLAEQEPTEEQTPGQQQSSTGREGTITIALQIPGKSSTLECSMIYAQSEMCKQKEK